MEKYRVIYESIRQRIESGEWKENDRIATEAELCREFGVSRITAMRAVNELENIGLLRRVAGRGTFVCRQETLNLVPFHLLVPNVKIRYYALMAEAIGDFFQSICLPVAVVCTQYDPEHTLSVLRSVRHTGSRGVAIVPHFAPGDLLQWLGMLSCPVAIASRALRDFSGKQVIVDEEAAGFMAASYLRERGHRRILYVGPTDEFTSPLRYRGALRGMGDGADENLLILDRIDSVSLLRLKEIFAGERAPTACIAADDLLAAGLYDQLKALDLEPGRRTALIGLDGSLLGLSLETPLTTVEFPGAEIGKQIAMVLLNLAQGGAAEKQKITTIAPKLVIRASCGETASFYRHEYLRDLLGDYR